MMFILQTLVLAQEAEKSGLFETVVQFLPMALVGLVFYLLLIRPSQQQRKKHEDLVHQLKNGDEITLNGGLYGKIVSMEESVATVEIAKNVKVKVLRDRIAGPWPSTPADSTKSAHK